jgi:hypothetical protein
MLAWQEKFGDDNILKHLLENSLTDKRIFRKYLELKRSETIAQTLIMIQLKTHIHSNHKILPAMGNNSFL